MAMVLTDTVLSRAVTLCLPPWRFWREALPHGQTLYRLACRADLERCDPGEKAQIARVFNILPRGFPVAALTREWDAGDAQGDTWLRADPGFVKPDMAAARLLACGDEMVLSQDESEALIQPLKPLFGDEGFLLSAPTPSRWYLCLPRESVLPDFLPPEEVIGDNLFAHLPDGNEGRRWRRLLNEAQMLLHNHPVNEIRVAEGKLPVNTVWFWGKGRLPDYVRSSRTQLRTGDVVLKSLAKQAALPLSTESDPATLPAGAVVDLRRVMAQESVTSDWIIPLMDGVRQGDFSALHLDFSDGVLMTWQARHSWRFWKKRLPA